MRSSNSLHSCSRTGSGQEWTWTWTGRLVAAQGPSRWLPAGSGAWPAAYFHAHDLFAHPVSSLTYFFPEELFHNLRWVTIPRWAQHSWTWKRGKKKSIQMIQSNSHSPGRKARREIKKCLGPALSPAFRLVSFLQQLTQIIGSWGPGLLDLLVSWSLCIQKFLQSLRMKSFSPLLCSVASSVPRAGSRLPIKPAVRVGSHCPKEAKSESDIGKWCRGVNAAVQFGTVGRAEL